MKSKLKNEDIQKIKNYFNLFDRDANGVIKSVEVGTVMRSLGLNPLESEVQELVREFDDGNGTIDLSEFI